MKIKLHRLPGFCTLLVLLTLGPGAAHAAALTWDGSANGLWTNAANWTPTFRPTNGDALLFPDGVVQTLVTNSPAGATNFHSITLAGSNYVLRSPFLALTNGLTNAGPVGAENTVAARVGLRASQTWEVAAQTSLVLASNVSFTNLIFSAASEGVLQFNNTITGGAGSVLNKFLGGTLEINGAATLTELTVQGGTLAVNGSLTAALTNFPGTTLRGTGSVPAFVAQGSVQPDGFGAQALTVASGTAVFNSGAIFRPTLNAPGTNFTQLRVASPPTLTGATLSVLLNYSPLLGDSFVIITNTGAAAFTTMFLGLPEGSTQIVNSVQFRISYVGGNGNDVTLTAVGFNASATTAVWDGGGGGSAWQTGLNWSNGLAPAGGANLLFPPGAAQRTNNNNFPNGTTFNAVTIQTNNYFITGNSVTLLGGIRASHTSGSASFNVPIHFSGAQTVRVDNAFRTLHLGFGGTALSNSGVLTVEGAGMASLNGDLGGTGGLALRGDTTLGGVNTYSGLTRIFSGALVSLATPQSLGSAAPADDTLVENGGSLFPLASMTNAEPVRLAGRLGSSVSFTWGGPITLLGSFAIFEPFNDAVLTVTNSLRGTNVLVTQQGDGTLILSASNSVTGTLLLNEGTLTINGASLGLEPYLNAGVLGGTGEVASITAAASGLVRPGLNRRGVLTCSKFTVDGSTPVFYVDVSATAHNQLRARSAVDLNGLLVVATVFNPALGVPFIIIDNESLDPVSGTFLSLPEGSSLTSSGLTYRVSYLGGDGNDVTLELISVSASGVTRLWDGGGVNNFWSNPTNWVGDTLPEVGDAILFPSNLGAGDFLTTNDLPAGFIFDQLIFRNGSGGVGTQLRGNSLGLLNGVLATNTADSVVISAPLVLAGAQAFALSAAPFTFSGGLSLNGDLTFGGNSNVSVTISGPISGSGGLSKTCPGILTLNGNNSFDGAVQLLNGSLIVGHASALGAAGGGTFVGAGTTLLLTLNDTLAENVLNVLGQVSITADCAISGELQLPNTFTSFGAGAGRQLILSGRLTGAGAPLFQGGGAFLLSGTNDCAGETSVQNSTLRVDGRNTTGDLNASVGSTLGGTGVVGRVSVANGGTLNPGASPGVLTSGNITFFAPSTLLLEINGLNPGTQYDQLNVNGSVTLSGVALTFSFGFTPLIGSSFTLIVNDGADAITGAFNGLPEGATFATNAATFRISYVGGDGNDVTITRVLAASGVTRIWDGGGANAAWSNRTNWVGDLAPLEGDDLVFPSVAARKNNTNDFAAFFGFNSLTVADGYVLGAAGVTLNAGLLATNAGGVTLNLPVLLNGSQSNFIAAGTTLTVNNGINLGASTLTWGVEGLLNLSGQLSGSGGLTKVGAGSVSLSGTNTLSGPLEFRGGSVSVLSSNVFGSAAGATTVGAGTLFQFNSAVTVAEPFVLNGLNASAVTMQFISGTSTLSGPITLGAQFASVRFNPQAGEVRLNGQLTGGSFSKEGAGRLVLNGGNLHTNVTSLNAGTLIINGSQFSSAVEVSGAGSILGGTGTTARVVAFGGTLSPGASPGRLTVAGGLTNNASVTNFFELDGPAPGGGYDQIAVVGNVGLNGCVLRLSFGFTPAFGDSFTLIDNQGLNPIGGTFAGLLEGSLITNGAVVARLTYLGGSGNDVVLTRIAVPTGVTRLWDGGGADNLWSNPLNWAGDILPQQGDDVVLPGTVAKAPLFDAGTNVAYNTLLLGRTYNLTVAAGNSLRLINALTTTNQTGLINLFVPVALQNNQMWNITHPGAQLIQRGPVDLSFATLTHGGAGHLSFNARVTGGGGLSGNSSAMLTLSGTNDFSGTVTVNSGTLDVQSSSALGSTLAGTFIGTAGRLSMDLPDGGAIDEPIILAGRVDVVLGVTNLWNGPVTLAGTQTAFDTLNSGALVVNGPLSGGAWQTLGIGSLVLNSPAGYTGPFRVGGGARVFVNGDHSTVSFTLTNTGILSGTGVVGPISTTCAGCEVNPGSRATPGVLHSSSVTLASGARLRARINGLADYDQLDVTGALTLTGASLVVTSGFNPDPGVSFTIINNDGADPVTGTFNGLPSGARVMSGAVTYQISYTGGDGNDVVLTRVVGAPPSTIQPITFSNGVPVLNGVGMPGVPYVLEATADLNVPIPWQPILTNTTDGAGVYQFLDHDGTNFPMRFYRVRSP